LFPFRARKTNVLLGEPYSKNNILPYTREKGMKLEEIIKQNLLHDNSITFSRNNQQDATL